MHLEEAERLHREAMELADQASAEAIAGARKEADRLFRLALAKEREAAEFVDTIPDYEPSRSILFRSAASLALECNDIRAAEQLVGKALAGNVTEELSLDLLDVLWQATFQRHLALKGVRLERGEFQMSLAGDGIGPGIASADAVVSRVRDLERIIHRTAERKAHLPFKEQPSGRGPREVEVFLSTARAASYAVTFRVGQSIQPTFPEMDVGDAIVEEVLGCLEDVRNNDTERLQSRIPDEAYRRNFLGLVRRIAPDGETVRLVGFTGSVRGREMKVALEPRTERYEALVSETPKLAKAEPVELVGVLKYADSRHEGKNEIRIVEDDGKQQRVSVPEGMMDDIVRPLWDYRVRLRGTRRSGALVLDAIERADLLPPAQAE